MQITNATLIFLDDVRETPTTYKGVTLRAYDYNSCIEILKKCQKDGIKDIIVDFDHDLGDGKSGYDVAKYLVENEITAKFHIHSMNPVGVQNIRDLLTHYGYEEIFNLY